MSDDNSTDFKKKYTQCTSNEKCTLGANRKMRKPKYPTHLFSPWQNNFNSSQKKTELIPSEKAPK